MVDGNGEVLGRLAGLDVNYVWFLDSAGYLWSVLNYTGALQDFPIGVLYFQAVGCSGQPFTTQFSLHQQIALSFRGRAYVKAGALQNSVPFASTQVASGACNNAIETVNAVPVVDVGPMPTGPVALPITVQ